jgi:hypothetical protein
MTTKTQAMTWLESQSENGYWNVACVCKDCTGKSWQKISISEMADRMVKSGLDFTKTASLKKLSHQIVQQGA